MADDAGHAYVVPMTRWRFLRLTSVYFLMCGLVLAALFFAEIGGRGGTPEQRLVETWGGPVFLVVFVLYAAFQVRGYVWALVGEEPVLWADADGLRYRGNGRLQQVRWSEVVAVGPPRRVRSLYPRSLFWRTCLLVHPAQGRPILIGEPEVGVPITTVERELRRRWERAGGRSDEVVPG
jgi:hypothetical protein